MSHKKAFLSCHVNGNELYEFNAFFSFSYLCLVSQLDLVVAVLTCDLCLLWMLVL